LDLVAQGLISPEANSDHYWKLVSKGIIFQDGSPEDVDSEEYANEETESDRKPSAKAKRTVLRMNDSENDNDELEHKPKPKRSRASTKPPQRSEKSFY
jgi:hypothetical protein